MSIIDPFELGRHGAFDDREESLSEHDRALALATRSYHLLAHCLMDGALRLASNGERECTEELHAMVLGPALAAFAEEWRAAVGAGRVGFATRDPMAWLDELVTACELVDTVCSLLIGACARDDQWYERPPANALRLIRREDPPGLPLLASEVRDVSRYALILVEEVGGAVFCL
jgi:hypothetical protein